MKFSSESVCLFFGWNKASCGSFVEVLIEEGVFIKYVSNFIVVDLHEVSNFIQTLIFTYCRYYYYYCYYYYYYYYFYYDITVIIIVTICTTYFLSHRDK